MSTTRSMVKAKVLQSVTGATKKPSTTTAAGNSLIDSTNSLGSHAPSVKKTTTASRSSLLPNSITTPITPRANTASAVSRVPSHAKPVDHMSRVSSQSAKPVVDNWAPLPTPVAISSSRSFSELMKSEESLQAQVTQLQAICQQLQRTVNEKDQENRALKAEIQSCQEQNLRMHASWESKSEALLAQQNEKYQDLNDRYLAVLTRARNCEAKLEELLVDPLTLEPFDRTVAERAKAEEQLHQQLALLKLIEDHQRNEDTVSQELKQATERMLKESVSEFVEEASSADDLVYFARTGLANVNLDPLLREVELTVPMLPAVSREIDADTIQDEENTDLDWSIMTSEADTDLRPKRSSMVHVASPAKMDSSHTTLATTTILEESTDDADDSFFDDSVCEVTPEGRDQLSSASADLALL